MVLVCNIPHAVYNEMVIVKRKLLVFVLLAAALNGWAQGSNVGMGGLDEGVASILERLNVVEKKNEAFNIFLNTTVSYEEPFEKGEQSGFHGRYMRFEARGFLDKHWSYRFRYRLKRLEKEKVKLEQIVEERTADLRNAQQELIRQEKMASVGKLTEGLIDRILNPMNYIINFSKMSIDLLNDLKGNFENNKDRMDEADYDDSEDLFGMLTENLDNVDSYGQNTTRILKAMEEMLKDRTSGYAEMDLLPILQQDEQMIDNYYANEKAQYGIQTVFTLPGESMPMYGNPEMLSKAIMSLFDNAVYAVVKKAQKQSEPVPQISLTATVSEGKYTLKIRDNGVGIEETILTKIFDPFFTTKTTSEAAGIGLYLSREIIQNHGGDISVTSVKDEYTEFTITLADKQ